jgi:hypothetical protein
MRAKLSPFVQTGLSAADIDEECQLRDRTISISAAGQAILGNRTRASSPWLCQQKSVRITRTYDTLRRMRAINVRLLFLVQKYHY